MEGVGPRILVCHIASGGRIVCACARAYFQRQEISKKIATCDLQMGSTRAALGTSSPLQRMHSMQARLVDWCVVSEHASLFSFRWTAKQSRLDALLLPRHEIVLAICYALRMCAETRNQPSLSLHRGWRGSRSAGTGRRLVSHEQFHGTEHELLDTARAHLP